MIENREKVIPIYIEDEMKSSYIDYSMSVIVGRALPDVRDGLKPVHRRILFSMREMGLTFNRPFKKSARVVGDVLGKYHPHGDMAVYDAMVRMVQEFSLRYPLLTGQGNFGSVDGDSPAAMRYTEIKLSQIAGEFLEDLDKETVDFVPNFDETLKEPLVLPSVIPDLLINGSSGIAVGMATNIPPHNLREVVNALIALLDNPGMEDRELLNYIQGPDFPTGAHIFGQQGIRDAYLTGRGRIIIRAKANIETTRAGKSRIIISEIPYQVNKAMLIEKIAATIKDKKVEGIADLRDESDRDGMRIVIDLKKGSFPEVVLNQLYKHTLLQSTFGVILLALDNNQPSVMTLRQILERFLSFREEIVTRRTRFELEKAEKRAHILEGLKIALRNIDKIIEIIKKSPDVQTAREDLMSNFGLSDTQAQAILDMRLQRLTGLERRKIEDEYLELIKLIEKLRAILSNRTLVLDVIREELTRISEKYGDQRRTEIVTDSSEFTIEDLIAEEDMIVTISHVGYIKRISISTYKKQRRGGRGISGMTTKEEDFVEQLFIASTHSYILIFTNIGRCHWLKVHEIPMAGRVSKGKAIVNLLQLSPEERMAAIVPVKDFDQEDYIVMVTRKGIIKKTPLKAFSHPKRGGIIAATVDEGDTLIDAQITTGSNDIILATRRGKAIKFAEKDVHATGRTARGVIGIRMKESDEIIGMVVVRRDSYLLSVCERGYGKHTSISSYRRQKRGGLGIKNIRTSERNGEVVSVREVLDTDELILITQYGMIIRLPVEGIPKRSRVTQGVKLINLKDGDKLVDVARVVAEKDDDIDGHEISATVEVDSSGEEITGEKGNGGAENGENADEDEVTGEERTEKTEKYEEAEDDMENVAKKKDGEEDEMNGKKGEEGKEG
jgi:DNA gyrase subunit A